MPDSRLEGEVALVTGGGSGLGLAIARGLAGAGARVVLVGRRRELLAEACRELGERATAVPADLADLGRLPPLVREIEAAAGPLSCLVHCAGNHLKKPAVETTDEEFLAVTGLHLTTAFALAREAGAGMLARGRGAILFVSSMAAILGVPGVAAYGAAKAGIEGLTRILAAEWSRRGVRVNAITPGWIDDGMARRAMAQDPERRARIMARIPMARLGRPEEIAAAAVFLVSPAASYVSGTVLVVDGGAAAGF